MKNVFILFLLTVFLACTKKEFNEVPDGFERLKVELLNANTPSCPDTSLKKTLDTIRGDLINYKVNFDILFPTVYNLCFITPPKFPEIDFNLKTLIIGYFPFHGDDGNAYLDSRVFINRAEKKIIIRGLIRNGRSGMTGSYSPSFIIDKVSSDYEIINEKIVRGLN